MVMNDARELDRRQLCVGLARAGQMFVEASLQKFALMDVWEEKAKTKNAWAAPTPHMRETGRCVVVL